MKTYTTQSGATLPLSAAIVQKIETATINDARRWNETQDKAAFIADFLGLFSINQLLNNPDLEDQVEQRFAALLGGAKRRPIKVGTCYTTADDNGVAVIGAQVEWSDGESGEMTWPNTDALCAFTRNYYGV
jgi:hypothetical protein